MRSAPPIRSEARATELDALAILDRQVSSGGRRDDFAGQAVDGFPHFAEAANGPWLNGAFRGTLPWLGSSHAKRRSRSGERS